MTFSRSIGRLKQLTKRSRLIVALYWKSSEAVHVAINSMFESVWSIDIFSGSDLLSLSARSQKPALTARDVTDVRALFVADPFLICQTNEPRWVLFFEVLNKQYTRGEIGVADSPDALHWTYRGIVLRESWHLSYPYVFHVNDQYYMIPESQAKRAIRLYRAKGFPDQWEYVGDLLTGSSFADTTLVWRSGYWWLFTYVSGKMELRLWYSDKIDGPWVEHPLSPIRQGSVKWTRPGGRIVEYCGRLLRFAQDGTKTYGGSLWVFVIEKLTPQDYQEVLYLDYPLLQGTGRGWNARGMHHLDLHRLEDGFVGAVDGHQLRFKMFL